MKLILYGIIIILITILIYFIYTRIYLSKPAVPVHQAPVHQAPVHQAPVHQAPVHQAPVHQAPVHQAPVHQAPIHQAPVQPSHLDDSEYKPRGFAEKKDEYILPKEYPNFIDDTERDYIMNMASDKFKPSMLARTTNVVDDKTRKSQTAWLEKDDPVVKNIIQRVCDLTNQPFDHAERLQVVKYEEGGFFNPHHDSFCDSKLGNWLLFEKKGQRVVTMIIYLSDDFEGGATRFPILNKEYKPPKNGAVLFYPLEKNGNRCHPYALHEGTRVTKGEKYICTVWIREKPQIYTKKVDTKDIEYKARGYAEETADYILPKEYSNFIDDTERDHIMNMASDKFKPSVLSSNINITEGKIDKKLRDSQTAWLNKEDPIIKNIIQRVCDLTNKPFENAENMQVVKYETDGFCSLHHDSGCDPEGDDWLVFEKRGQRVVTMLIYLSDGFEGGNTVFPLLNKEYKPPKNGSILFYPLEKNGNRCHPLAIHRGTPVTKGEKYICTVWIREKPQIYENGKYVGN